MLGREDFIHQIWVRNILQSLARFHDYGETTCEAFQPSFLMMINTLKADKHGSIKENEDTPLTSSM
jgi:hypothetical protein